MSLSQEDAEEVSEADIVIKSESHYSKADQEQEAYLIENFDFDAVMFEGSREQVESLNQPGVFDVILSLTFFILSPLYKSPVPNLVKSLKGGKDIYYTREKDGEVVSELPFIPRTGILAVWTTLLASSMILGLPMGDFRLLGFDVPWIALSLFSFLALFSIPIVVRILRSYTLDSLNRNKIIANKAESAFQSSGKTVIFLGARHSEQVKSHISDEFEVKIVGVCNGLRSRSGIRELLTGLIPVVGLFTGIWLFVETIGSILIALLLQVLVY